MTQQPSTRARTVTTMQHDSAHIVSSRVYFKRSALGTALATALFGIAPAALAETTGNNSTANQSITNQAAVTSASDTQLDNALDALRLKKAVQQGVIEQSVLDDYSEQTLGIKKSDTTNSASQNRSVQQTNRASDDLLQQATAIQQQGYQMMTPEQIDREVDNSLLLCS